jgi:ABC-type oligopeptide transport system substrate-binding subunit
MNRTRIGVAAILAAALATLGLAACGSSNSNSADEDQITAAITAAAASGDPSACTKYQTQRFVEQTNSGTGQAAVRSCEKDAANSVAKSVDVTDISVNGDTASAKVHVTGSIFDGQTLNVKLIKQNGVWKLDQFVSFENFNKDAMVAAFPATLQQEGNVPAQAVDCLKTQLQQQSEQTIEQSFVSGNNQLEQLVFNPCAKYFKGG